MLTPFGFELQSSLLPSTAKTLGGLRNFLNMNRPEHHSTERPKDSDRERERRGGEGGGGGGGGRSSTLRGQGRSVLNQPHTDPVSRATFGEELLRNGSERVRPFRTLRCHLEQKLKLAVQSSNQ